MAETKNKRTKKGILFVVSAPSGAGKTTLVHELLKRNRNLAKTVSHTTRNPRKGEKNTRDYYFVSDRQFQALVKKNGFVEWAWIYKNRYGTSHKTIRENWRAGKDAVLVIDGQGGRNIQKKYRDQAVFILILPPNLTELKKRIRNRAGQSAVESQISLRVREARREVRNMWWYDYVVVNDRLPQALGELQAIVDAERLRLSRNTPKLRGF